MVKIINTAEYQLQQLSWQPKHFQQYGATAHRARVTVEYLHQLFTPKFISPDLWQPNRPDLNPVERVYQKRIRDVDVVKQRFVEVWSDFGHTSTRRCFQSSVSRMRF